MPKSVDEDVSPETPPQNRVPVRKPNPYDPTPIALYLFSLVVDRPVTAFHDWVEQQRAKRRSYYYHREFRRIPDITYCLEDDYLCQYEANKQWKRDYMVDQEIVKIIQGRVEACRVREGPNAAENCVPVNKQYEEVCKGYKSRYEDLGYYSSAKKCLMKQKARMMEERKAAAQGKTNPEE